MNEWQAMMQEIGDLIAQVGSPIAFALALGYALYKVGSICGTLLIEAWKAKDTRLSELEIRVNTINNGQREALERRLDASIEHQQQSNECLNKLADAFHFFATKRPCIHDSDLVLVSDATPNPSDKTLRVINRKKDRDAKRAEPSKE